MSLTQHNINVRNKKIGLNVNFTSVLSNIKYIERPHLREILKEIRIYIYIYIYMMNCLVSI